MEQHGVGDPVFPVKPAWLWLPQGQRQRPGGADLLDLHRRKEAARRKLREERARQARQAAIQVPGCPEPLGEDLRVPESTSVPLGACALPSPHHWTLGSSLGRVGETA